jgi:PHD/YefM family antitoxin component YafN of YafNO toxin-antitoxin module
MPIRFRSVKELKEQTPQVLKDVEEADIVVTVHGKPRAILRRFTEEELGEAIARSEEIRKRLAAAAEDLRAGRTTKAPLASRKAPPASRLPVKRAARRA